MSFLTIPLRTNGYKIQNGWFDALRAAGVLIENFLGGGYVGKTDFSIPNNSAAVDVTGLLFNGSTTRAAFVFFGAFRKTDSENKAGSGMLFLAYNAEASVGEKWSITPLGGGVDHGCTFSATDAGQVQLASDNMTGSYDTVASKLGFTAITIGV